MSANIQTQPSPTGALLGLMHQPARFAPAAPQTWSDRLNRTFDDLVEQSNLGVAPPLALSLTVAFSVFMAGAAFVYAETLVAAAIGLIGGGGVAFFVFHSARSWRFRRVLQQLPDGVDLLSRSVRAGRSLDQAIQDMSRELPAPLGAEFQRVAARLELGMPIGAALRDIVRRFPLPAVQIFATALTIHQQTGGNLVHALEQLAQTIRERAEFRGRFMAATAGSRFSIILLLAIGPAILVYQSFVDPTMLRSLTSDPFGRGILLTAAVLQLLGSLIVLRILSSGVDESKL